jgi:5-methylcytosine-specific restriction protein A
MFDALAVAIEELEIGIAGDAIAAALALRDRLDSKITAAVGGFDAAELYDVDGATSTTAWLRGHGLNHKGAARLARSARTLQQLPATGEAWREGELSGGQVEVILANVPNWATKLFAQHEEALLPTLVPLDSFALSLAMQKWKRDAEDELDRTDPEPPRRSLHHSPTLDGRFETKAGFDPEGGTLLATALRLAESPDGEGESRSAAERRADALVDVCRWFLDHQDHVPKKRNRPHLNVVIGLESLAGVGGGELLGGGLLDATTIKRLLCDAGIHRVLTEGGSTILDYGRQTRGVPDPMWNALVLRDRGCRLPWCDRGPDWCEAHHVVPWSEGGTTDLANLVLKCTRDHHRCHLPGWSEKLHPDGTLEITMPDGRVLVSKPPGVLRC